jgi:hypothetical protein
MSVDRIEQNNATDMLLGYQGYEAYGKRTPNGFLKHLNKQVKYVALIEILCFRFVLCVP